MEKITIDLPIETYEKLKFLSEAAHVTVEEAASRILMKGVYDNFESFRKSHEHMKDKIFREFYELFNGSVKEEK